ncbi:hypothetical protein BKK49_05580 [Rodentibacter rarus]|uniref:PD-(D/E)XK nuclease superfamily protein n=1 Tax=Rodentibacter rarus TaxID=1908260 RepID=A0A1V3IKG5_9PAST|nr:PD-(D/E)XK nuclease family protein [Rodentibacter rarus]OOF40923.1 hypothetical protein BKK49_05580 [Rodentibacter rarus]OOF41989.1 hypothetical protein BKK50_07800 [Rodentibacter rarus]
MNEIINNLLSIKQKLDEFESERRKTELYNSNRFNPFQFMRTDEIGLSKILAFLLDPKEIHGQGDLFLNSFLKFIGKHNFLAYNSTKVSVEKPTRENRRHDIFIEGFLDNKRRWIVSIENKLRFASDQEEQLKDYRIDIERYKGADYCLIYLPVFKHNPSESSISESEWEELINHQNAILLSAEDLIKWLDNTLIVAPAVRQFCYDFKKFLKEELMGNTERANDLVNYLLEKENNEALYSALNILDSYEQLYENLAGTLVNQLQERFEKNYKALNNYGWKCNFNGYATEKEAGIFLDQENIYWGVGIEFSERNFRNGYYGIYCHKEKYGELHKLLQDIFDEEEIKADFKSSKWWAMWKWLEGNLLNWDAEVLSKIPSGELADQIFELWKPLLDVITENLDKIKELEIKKL